MTNPNLTLVRTVLNLVHGILGETEASLLPGLVDAPTAAHKTTVAKLAIAELIDHIDP